MKFITGLSIVEGKDHIYGIVDRLTKFAHFFVVPSTSSTHQIIELFFKEIFILHGFPKIIIGDRYNKFTSSFWKELFELVGTKFNLSTSYHLKTDSQTERVK